MNIFKKIYCRSFQTVFKIALPFLPYRKPKIVSALSDIPSVLNKKKKSCPIIITDPGIAKLGILSMLTDVFDNAGIEYHVYDKTVANPTTDTVEEALAIYKDNKCDCIIGFGGGSSMDCAKAVGVRIARPKTHLSKLGGILKVHAKLPLLVAIPTTAGTGSETTLAAVIVDATTRHKYAINDFPLIPRYAVLDPKVTLTLPASITATTGMDALTHAVEAYISRSFFADSSIHACLFRSLLLRLLSFDFSLCIFLAQAGQYFEMPERGTYSTPHTVQFLGFNAVHRFVGVICNSPTKPMNL